MVLAITQNNTGQQLSTVNASSTAQLAAPPPRDQRPLPVPNGANIVAVHSFKEFPGVDGASRLMRRAIVGDTTRYSASFPTKLNGAAKAVAQRT